MGAAIIIHPCFLPKLLTAPKSPILLPLWQGILILCETLNLSDNIFPRSSLKVLRWFHQMPAMDLL